MIKFKVIDSNKFDYWTDADPINSTIFVYEYDELIYETDVFLDVDVVYYTALTNNWNNKTVKIINNDGDDIVNFEIVGMINKLSEEQKIKFEKYCKYVSLSDNTTLCDIMNKNKSDKASRIGTSSGHNYTKYYDLIFDSRRYDNVNMFELGLGTNNINFTSNMGENGVPGASIFGWNEYFINGNIYGADIDTGCLFVTNDIRTFYCDQTDPWIIKQMWDNKYLDFDIDIIIEDGLHTFDANITFFENSYHKLHKNGIYIIEDINSNEIVNWLNKFEEYEIKFPQFNFELLFLDCEYNRIDNNLIKITYK